MGPAGCVQEAIEQGVRQYLKDLAMSDPLVRYNRIANVILDIPSVIDYEVLTVNGGTDSLPIERKQWLSWGR